MTATTLQERSIPTMGCMPPKSHGWRTCLGAIHGTLRVSAVRGHVRAGFVTFYGLVVLLILGIYLAGIQFTSLDQAMIHKMTIFDAQIRQAADAGMSICLRVASTTARIIPNANILQIGTNPYLLTFPPGGVASSAIIFYQTSMALYPTYISEASVTVYLYDRLATDPTSPWVARRTLRNSIDVNTRRFQNAWTR